MPSGLEIKQGHPSPSLFPPLRPELLPRACAGGRLHASDCGPFPGTQLWDCSQQLGTCLASGKLTKLKLRGSQEEKRTHWDLRVSGAKSKNALECPPNTICQPDPPGPSSSGWWLFIGSVFLLDPRWTSPARWGQVGQRSLTLNLPTKYL